MMRQILPGALLAGLCSTANAADNFIEGVYLQSEELFAQAKADDLQTIIEAGNVILTADGIQSIEYDCEFVRIDSGTRSPAWVVTTLCQEPGYLFPDVFSIVELSPKQLDLVSVRPVDPESGGNSNSGSYYLCDGVEAP